MFEGQQRVLTEHVIVKLFTVNLYYKRNYYFTNKRMGISIYYDNDAQQRMYY